MSEPNKVFSEKQASEILQKAAQLQEETGVAGTYAPGLSREEILKIAAEAGISPENVEAAIRASSTTQPKKAIFDLVSDEERVVEGEINSDDFDLILEVAKPARTRRHPARQVGRTLTFQTRYKGTLYNVNVSSRNGRTKIQVASVPIMAYLMSLHPALLVAFFGSANLGAAGVNLGAVLFAMVSIIIGMLAFVGLVRHGKSKTPELADLLETKVKELASDVRGNLANSSSVVTPDEQTSLSQTI